MVCIWVFLSALSCVIELCPCPLDAAVCVSNDFSSSLCLTMWFHYNHSCVWHLSLELSLSASEILEYQSLLNAGNMWYFLASYQVTHLAMYSMRFAISSSHFFCSLYCVTVVMVHILLQMFLNSSLKLIHSLIKALFTSFFVMHLTIDYL